MNIDSFPLRAKRQRYDKPMLKMFLFREGDFVVPHGLGEEEKLPCVVLGRGQGYQGYSVEKSELEYLAVRVPAYRFLPDYAVCQLYSRKAIKAV